ncbi:hypothetical protein NLI96_g10236 [Meripilus lineatus]|uniref:Uncharacterized protein n=1 Tax=Meripilus lineatus TaxID=2056292 RepID=A0AAD5YEJ0_9APHY|nr:hypothetical protein NLI96_g10236 [Physisporinus lineatus]
MTAPLVFPYADPAELLQHYNLSKFNGAEKQSCTFELAPSFGSNPTLKGLNDDLKVLAKSATEEIARLAPTERSWKNVSSHLANNPLISPHNFDETRADLLVKEGRHMFVRNDDHPADPKFIDEVRVWFETLVGDKDIIAVLPVDFPSLSRILTQTGVPVTGIKSILYRTEDFSQDLMDIGILMYPDSERPYIKASIINRYSIAFQLHDLSSYVVSR